MLGGVTERMSVLSLFFLCSRSDWIKVKHCYYLTSSPVPVLSPASAIVTDALLISDVCLPGLVRNAHLGRCMRLGTILHNFPHTKVKHALREACSA